GPLLPAAGGGAWVGVRAAGSGVGDVGLVLADLVGPSGAVVGVEANPDIVESASARVDAAGWRNVSFVVGDLRDAPVPEGFDAVVGRWVLMYQPDPADVLRRLATRVRIGGIVAFHENDFSYPPTGVPESDLARQSLP